MLPTITQKRVHKLFDYSNGILFRKISFGGLPQGTPVGTDCNGYKIAGFDGEQYPVHRIVWVWHNGEIPVGFKVDHINGNTVDNRIENLRLASQSENMCNAGKPLNNTSGFKGVSFFKRNRRWAAYTMKNRKKIHFGYFDSAIEAAKAYNANIIFHHGEFARLNPIS